MELKQVFTLIIKSFNFVQKLHFLFKNRNLFKIKILKIRFRNFSQKRKKI